MNYRIFSAAAISVYIIMAIFISGPAIAEETAVQGTKLTSPHTTFEGTLVIKEGHGDILVRSEDGHQRRLKVKQSTIITRNGKPAGFDDLQVHDHVRVSYNAKSVAIELDASGS